MTQIQKKFGRRRMKWTMATIRSRMDHHEKAKSRNDPIAKSHYSMRALTCDGTVFQAKGRACPERSQRDLACRPEPPTFPFSFGCRVMVVAHHACDFPGAVFVLPQVHKLAFAA